MKKPWRLFFIYTFIGIASAYFGAAFKDQSLNPCGNILTGEKYGASAVVCDACLPKPIINVIELKDEEVILHPVSELKRLPTIQNN